MWNGRVRLPFSSIRARFSAVPGPAALIRIPRTGRWRPSSARQWDQETGKFYSNIQYAPIEGGAAPKPLTTWSLEKSDSSPVFSPIYKDNVLFIRTANGRSHVYTMVFDPKAEVQPEPTQLTNYPIDVSNLLFNQNLLMFSAEMYFDCNTMQCTADKNAEVAKRGANTYQIYDELMIRHWDVWYTQGSASHPFYQKIKQNEETKQLELDGDAVDVLLNQKLSNFVPFLIFEIRQ